MNRPRVAALALLLAAAPSAAEAGTVAKTTRILPHQRTVQVRWANESSSPVPAKDVRDALRRSIATWNGALPADLQLVEKPFDDPLPKGEVVVVCRFEADGSLFKGQGVDEFAFTSTMLDRNENHAVTYITFNDSERFRASGGFSTTGADGSYDLEIVMLHEIGHALGLQHDPTADAIPPIMAPQLEPNAKLRARTGQTLDLLRRLPPADRDRAAFAVKERARLDLSGSYAGELKITKAPAAATLAVDTAIRIKSGDFVLQQDAERVSLSYKGSTAEAPVVSLLDFPLQFSTIKNPRTLVSATLEPGDAENQVKVTLEIKPTRDTYKVEGTLTRN